MAPVLSRLALLATLWASTALAHHEPISTSRFRAHAGDGAVGATFTITGPDVVALAGLDSGAPLPALGSREREAAIHARILQAVASVVTLTNDGEPCRVTPLQVFARKGYEVSLRWQCTAPLGTLVVSPGYFDRLPGDHRHLLSFDSGVRVGGATDGVETLTLDRGQPTFQHVFPRSVVAAAPGSGSAAATDPSDVGSGRIAFGAAVALGLHHIAAGPDHLLFILGILLVARRIRPVVVLATTFTLAHSATLALAVLGVVTLSSAVVEPLIAASLVVIAVEGVLVREAVGAGPRRVALVFAFGLLHGLGFAGGLMDLNLSGGGLAQALLGFNVGVELGQLAVAAVALPLLSAAAGRPWYRSWVQAPAAVLIGLMGAYWVVERTLLV